MPTQGNSSLLLYWVILTKQERLRVQPGAWDSLQAQEGIELDNGIFFKFTVTTSQFWEFNCQIYTSK